jgi:Rab-GTPase-TBC domain
VLLHVRATAAAVLLQVLASQWFLTLFAYSLPLSALLASWDVVFAQGWKALFRLGIGRLKTVETQLLGLEIGESC